MLSNYVYWHNLLTFNLAAVIISSNIKGENPKKLTN